MTPLILALAILPPYATPGTSDRVATVQLAGTPSGALVEMRAPNSRAWVIAGIVPGFVTIRLESGGFYSFRYSAPGRAPAARVIYLRQGDQARIELNLAEDPAAPLFYGSWLAFVSDGDIRAVQMVESSVERPERVLVPDAGASRVDWLRDGRLLYQQEPDGLLVLVDLDSGTDQRTVPAMAGFRLVAGHPDGAHALGLDTAGLPVLCSLKDGQVTPVPVGASPGGWAALSSDGRRVAVPAPVEDRPGDIAVHDLDTGQQLTRITWARHVAPPGEGAFIGGGHRLLLIPYLGPSSGRARLLDLDSVLLWLGPDGLRSICAAPDGIHFAAERGDRDRHVVFGMLGSQETVDLGVGTSPTWSPPPTR